MYCKQKDLKRHLWGTVWEGGWEKLLGEGHLKTPLE